LIKLPVHIKRVSNNWRAAVNADLLGGGKSDLNAESFADITLPLGTRCSLPASMIKDSEIQCIARDKKGRR
jgi:hypothetical protein